MTCVHPNGSNSGFLTRSIAGLVPVPYAIASLQACEDAPPRGRPARAVGPQANIPFMAHASWQWGVNPVWGPLAVLLALLGALIIGDPGRIDWHYLGSPATSAGVDLDAACRA
jgi:hypothetical protein